MRNLGRLLRHIPFMLLIVVSTSAFAQSSSATDAQAHFNAGTQAFKSGHYREAAGEFELARHAGMENAALWYNLGVCYYRLGQYDRSETAFRRTAHYEAMAPVAYYNLGLIDVRRGRIAQARGWFKRAHDDTYDPKLLALASHMLVQTERRERKHKAWTSILYASLGRDDNVTLENTPLARATGKSDTFAELFASTRGVLAGQSTNGLLVKANAYRLAYQNMSQFDMTVLSAGLFAAHPLGDWGAEAGARYSHSSLGGTDYLGTSSLSLAATDNLSVTTRVRLRYRYYHDSALNNRYDYLNGNVHDLRAEGRWLLNKGRRVRAFYRLEIENRNDLRTATTFTSFSPTRQTVHVDLTLPLAVKWDADGTLEYRRSRYADASVLAGGRSTRREDNRWRERLTFMRQLNRRAALRLQYMHTNNDSNIATYSYSRNVLSAAVEYIF